MNTKQITSLTIILFGMVLSIHASLKLAMTIITPWLHYALVWLSTLWIIYLGSFAIYKFHHALKSKKTSRTHFNQIDRP